mmetsp:Transcript_12911/g.23234  ORF Transcript_12911/g.23234 Transcript_12911/m.23234 type:complete len:95 (-) Transcript_12911:1400-1684(-)
MQVQDRRECESRVHQRTPRSGIGGLLAKTGSHASQRLWNEAQRPLVAQADTGGEERGGNTGTLEAGWAVGRDQARRTHTVMSGGAPIASPFVLA